MRARNATIVASMMAMAVLLLAIPGCEKPNPETVMKALSMAGKEGTNFGLRKWAEDHPEDATEAATKLKKNIDEVLLPYLDGGNLPSSAQVQAFIESSLFNDVKPEIKVAVVTASVALDAVLPVPNADTYLKDEHVGYIRSFLSGVSEGCERFLSRDVASPETHWIK